MHPQSASTVLLFLMHSLAISRLRGSSKNRSISSRTLPGLLWIALQSDLIRRIVNLALLKDELLLARPGGTPVNGRCIRTGVEGLPKALVVNGNDAFKCFAQVCNPGHEAVLKRLPNQDVQTVFPTDHDLGFPRRVESGAVMRASFQCRGQWRSSSALRISRHTEPEKKKEKNLFERVEYLRLLTWTFYHLKMGQKIWVWGAARWGQAIAPKKGALHTFDSGKCNKC